MVFAVQKRYFKQKIGIIFKRGIDNTRIIWYNTRVVKNAAIAQMVERILGKDEVISSILISSSIKNLAKARFFGFIRF